MNHQTAKTCFAFTIHIPMIVFYGKLACYNTTLEYLQDESGEEALLFGYASACIVTATISHLRRSDSFQLTVCQVSLAVACNQLLPPSLINKLLQAVDVDSNSNDSNADSESNSCTVDSCPAPGTGNRIIFDL